MEEQKDESREKKAMLRAGILARRKELSAEERKEWDGRISKRLFQSEEFKAALNASPRPCVYCYVSVRNEAGTEGIIRELLGMGCTVAVPRVEGKEMAFYYIGGPEDLVCGCMNIPEPAKGCVLAEEKAAPVIVPGVAFGEDGSRTGYGGGYYDRFFEREPGHLKIGVCYEFQLKGAVPSGPFDVKMDWIVTERRSLRPDWAEKERAGNGNPQQPDTGRG